MCCLPRCRRRPRTSIAPRRLEKRVRYFTQRFAPHAPRWQWAIWARQLALIVVIGVVKFVTTYDHAAVVPLRYPTALLFVAIILVALWAQLRVAPYAYRLQNYLKWLEEHSMAGFNEYLARTEAAFFNKDKVGAH